MKRLGPSRARRLSLGKAAWSSSICVLYCVRSTLRMVTMRELSQGLFGGTWLSKSCVPPARGSGRNAERWAWTRFAVPHFAAAR